MTEIVSQIPVYNLTYATGGIQGTIMEVGNKMELAYQVQAQDLAKALSSDPQDDFPAVLATSRLGCFDGVGRSTPDEA